MDRWKDWQNLVHKTSLAITRGLKKWIINIKPPLDQF